MKSESFGENVFAKVVSVFKGLVLKAYVGRLENLNRGYLMHDEAQQLEKSFRNWFLSLIKCGSTDVENYFLTDGRVQSVHDDFDPCASSFGSTPKVSEASFLFTVTQEKDEGLCLYVYYNEDRLNYLQGDTEGATFAYDRSLSQLEDALTVFKELIEASRI